VSTGRAHTGIAEFVALILAAASTSQHQEDKHP
jgi:hypothetical protein